MDNLVREKEEQKKASNNITAPSTNMSTSLDSETIHVIHDEEVNSIINEIMSNQCNQTIDTIWHTVEHSDYDVSDFGVLIVLSFNH